MVISVISCDCKKNRLYSLFSTEIRNSKLCWQLVAQPLTEASKLAVGRGSITKYIRYNKGQEIPDTGGEREKQKNRVPAFFYSIKLPFFIYQELILWESCFFLFLFLCFGFPFWFSLRSVLSFQHFPPLRLFLFAYCFLKIYIYCWESCSWVLSCTRGATNSSYKVNLNFRKRKICSTNITVKKKKKSITLWYSLSV